MKKWLIILIFVIAIVLISILLSNLPFDVTPNNNVSYQDRCSNAKNMVLNSFVNEFNFKTDNWIFY